MRTDRLTDMTVRTKAFHNLSIKHKNIICLITKTNKDVVYNNHDYCLILWSDLIQKENNASEKLLQNRNVV
jgi:hypothetical protein